MKRFICLWMGYSLLCTLAFAQSGFEADGDCSPNIFTPHPFMPNPTLARATFKYFIYQNATANSGRTSCTGTLVNQVVDGKPRQLFLTARHCLHTGSNGGGPLVDLSGMDFIFNFQSPTPNTQSTPAATPFVMSNRGDLNPPRLRYTFRSPVNLIYESTALFGTGYGIDMALLEIQRPIPPHFNVYYAGWKTNDPTGPFGDFDAPMTVIHHPRGDVKKYASTNQILKLNTPVATGCRLVTRVIDFVIRLFGGKAITEMVCSWVDIPQYTIPSLLVGSLSRGSSGAPLFTNGNRLFATTTGTFGSGFCDVYAQTFGKFRSAYSSRQVRDYLNPSYRNSANLFGYDGRNIGCYPDNPLRLSGEYFAATGYQADNAITISAQQNIEAGQVDFDQARGITAFVDYDAAGAATTPPGGSDYEERRLRIYNGADFTFTAGEQIRLLPGFTVDAGASFTARIQNCNANFRKGSDDPVEEAKALLSQVVLPTPIERTEEKPRLVLSPNPSGDQVACDYWVRQPGAVQIWVFDEQGRQVSTLLQAANEQPGPYRIERSIRDLEPGTYIVQMKSQNYNESKRLLVQR